jgi:hypothetical protein
MEGRPYIVIYEPKYRGDFVKELLSWDKKRIKAFLKELLLDRKKAEIGFTTEKNDEHVCDSWLKLAEIYGLKRKGEPFLFR